MYLDASVVIPLFVAETRSDVADRTIRDQDLVVSDLAAAEFSSAMSRRIRDGSISRTAAESILSRFDIWIAEAARREVIVRADFAAATAFIRRFDLGLRTPDALHIAIAQRLGATLFTFDASMAAAATALGVTLAS